MTTEPTAAKKAVAAVRLDEPALARLRELDPCGRNGVVMRVLAAFETSLARMLTQLQAERTAVRADGLADGHADGHAAVVAGVAHMLKSSSASVGALELAKACAEIELKLRHGDASGLQGDISRLISAGESALQAVAAILRP